MWTRIPRVLQAVIGLAILALAVGLRASFFFVSVRYLPTNTDEALNQLMARAIAAGHFPLLFWSQPYQFPLEAYILSLFVGVLPPNAFGARVILAAVSCLSLVGFCWVALRTDTLKRIWPALLLTLLPSAYFITRQAGYLIPQYASTITFAWLLPLLFLYSRRRPSGCWPLALGITAGLALSVHLLSLPIVLMVGVACCLGTSFRSACRNTALFVPALLIGLIPYLLACLRPGAYGTVTETIGIRAALARVVHPILTEIMPVPLGVIAIDFPDMGQGIGTFECLRLPFVTGFVLALITATALRSVRIVRALCRREWPTLEIHDVFIGALWLNLIAAAFARFGIKFRYLLPMAFYFPFLMSYLYACCDVRIWRAALAAVVVLLAAVNVHNTRTVTKAWIRSDFSRTPILLPHLAPLIACLDAKGIRHCYANWWLAYRIPYETAGRIEAAQPFNERFPGWPLPPSKLQVDRVPATPYVLQANLRSEFDKKFREELAEHRIEFDVTRLNLFELYENFRHCQVHHSHRLAPGSFALQSSHAPLGLESLVDRDLATTWTSPAPPPAFIRIAFAQTQTVHIIRLFIAGKSHREDARPLSLIACRGTMETELLPEVPNQPRHLAESRRRGLPHLVKIGSDPALAGHDRVELLYGFAPTDMDALLIRNTAPSRSGRPWALAELEVFGTAAPRPQITVEDRSAD